MKNKKILYITLAVAIILSILIYFILNNKSYLTEISYDEIIEKIDNKESFILCITATDCIHCQNYKPKLEKIIKEYNITIYNTNIDNMTEEEYENFKTRLSFDGGTPVTIFIKDGTETTTATRIEGNVSIEKIIKKLQKNDYIE